MGFFMYTDPAILRALNILTKKVDLLMTTANELQTALETATTTLTAVQANVENIAADVAALDAEILSLKDALSTQAIPASAVTAIDNLTTLANSLSTRTAAVAAQTPDTANPV